MGLASRAQLVYLRAVRVAFLAVSIFAAAVLPPTSARAVEQKIEVLTPPHEQRVETLGGTDDLQQVQALDDSRTQIVGPHEPPTPAVKAASTAGKIVLGVAAAAVAVGATLASLLFF